MDRDGANFSGLCLALPLGLSGLRRLYTGLQHPRRRKAVCGFGGGLGWLVYLLAGSSIVAAFLAAVAIGVFSEIMARLRRCPVTGYLLVALLPLVPGGGIYYAMSYCVAGDTDRFLAELLHTFGMAAALAVGAMLASSVFRTVFPRLYHRPAGS